MKLPVEVGPTIFGTLKTFDYPLGDFPIKRELVYPHLNAETDPQETMECVDIFMASEYKYEIGKILNERWKLSLQQAESNKIRYRDSLNAARQELLNVKTMLSLLIGKKYMGYMPVYLQDASAEAKNLKAAKSAAELEVSNRVKLAENSVQGIIEASANLGAHSLKMNSLVLFNDLVIALSHLKGDQASMIVDYQKLAIRFALAQVDASKLVSIKAVSLHMAQEIGTEDVKSEMAMQDLNLVQPHPSQDVRTPLTVFYSGPLNSFVLYGDFKNLFVKFTFDETQASDRKIEKLPAEPGSFPAIEASMRGALEFRWDYPIFLLIRRECLVLLQGQVKIISQDPHHIDMVLQTRTRQWKRVHVGFSSGVAMEARELQLVESLRAHYASHHTGDCLFYPVFRQL